MCVLSFDIFNGCSTSIKEIDKAMCVILFHVFNGCSTSIKEINRLIWKEMSNIYYWEKLQKNSQNPDFLRKKILQNPLILNSKKT